VKQALVTIDYKSLPFAQRLALVQACICDRVSEVQPSEQAALKARLWCVWLSREVLL